MDPDANLQEQKELAQAILEDKYPVGEETEAAANRLAELVLALDEWLRNDGFLPRSWKTSHHP